MMLIKQRDGFTLIEVIVVLVVIAVLTIALLSRMIFSTSDVNVNAQAEAVKSHIRYTQMRGLNADPDPTIPSCHSSFGFSSTGSTYFSFNNCSTANKVVLPGANNSTITLPSGMSLTATTITIDEYGRPCSDMNGSLPITSNITLTLTYKGSSVPITITRNTGFVP